ncbi:MAG: DUF445 domain-containing protein [Ignavibacteriae bacterium]|nr:DUF445 domain-containing protein [Ignavibacteriota bacterium]MCB9215391.1 DUF445 domain-containing protein [Ignavibacteria bacterium]
MKLIATGAFLLMVALFILSHQFGNQSLLFFIRWDHLNAFSEAAMIGALADWFAVVALFRHPLGIPIWHTAIIPKRKDEIGRNLANFVENRLLSVENLSREIERLSIASAAATWLKGEENRNRLSNWLADGLATLVRGFDDSEMRGAVAEVVTRRLTAVDGASLLSSGLNMIVDSGKHHQLIDTGLQRVADWLPSRRETVKEFVEGAVERTLKWGSNLVPDKVIDRATDRTLEALIQVFREAAADPKHPLRADISERIVEWIERLESDVEWREKIDTWKQEAIDSPRLREMIARIWEEGKERLLNDIQEEDSSIRHYISRAVSRFADRLNQDEALRNTLDERLRSVVTTFLNNHHGEIGALVERIIDSWDGDQLANEMELNLGKDLQYIRLNGTFIGGIVGLIIHLLT